MAVKQYGYYLKGNKIALVEKDTSFDNDVTSKEYGPGSDRAQWKSPKSTVDNGIEIQYTYAPTFNLQSTGTEGTDFHRFIGWGSNGTNLLLFTYGSAAVADLSSIFDADDWIYIEGSGRWSGLHQVKSTGGATGILTLKTKCNLKPSAISVVVDFTAKGYLSGDTAAATMDIEAFKDLSSTRVNPYVFINSAVDAPSNGIFSVSYPDTSGQIDFVNKITIDADGDYTSTEEAIEAENADTIDILNIYYEQISVYEGVDVLEDETFDIDLPDYMCKAIVLYLKARTAEDIKDIQGYEYYMNRFRKQIEEFKSARHAGPKMVSSFWHMR